MNIYEIIGRILLLHQNCEDIFSSCGNILDRLIANTKSDETTDPAGCLLDISIKLKELEIELEEYNKVINENIANKIVNNDS